MTAVQIPIEDWKKLKRKIQKYEQALQFKEDLTAALEEVRQMREGKIPKQTLSEFFE